MGTHRAVLTARMPDSQFPQVWQADLLLNASRYVWIRAKADPATLSATWGTWMVASEVAAAASLTIIAGILHSKAARSNVFNLLIVFLCVPDFIFSSLCGVTCALSYKADEYYGGPLGCEWQAFYVIFGFAGSMWMQVIIAAELRHVLRCSHERRSYVQLTLQQVLRRAGAVYALTLFIASWMFLDAIPVRPAPGSGMACVPLASDPGSEAFLWVVYLGVVAFLPLGGILYIAWDVFSHGFHRGVNGAMHELLVFFVLVLSVYLVMWLPSVATIWVFDARIPGGNAFNFFGGLWSHLQGLVSAILFLRKRDVLDAVRRLPLVGCAVGVLVGCLPGFRPRLAGVRPGATSANTNLYAPGNDPRADDDGARWIMGRNLPEALEMSAVKSRQDKAASPPGAAQRDAPGAEDLACFPPQFPLRSGRGLVGKLSTLFAPRFADRYFEQRYRQHRANDLDSVQLWFACAMVFYVVSLWIYYFADGYDRNANMTPGSRQLKVELVLPHAALFVAWVTWALLRALPCARARGSELQAVQVSVLVALFCWGLPATAKKMCLDTHNTNPYDGNLQQTLFMLLCYAAVFCRIGTDEFVMLCLVTATNFIAARSTWKQLDTHQHFALSFEAPKLIATLIMLGAGVRWTDLQLRRGFAARELMLIVIGEQAREMEAALKVAAAMGREMEAAAGSG